MQQIDCPLCESMAYAPVAVVRDRLLGMDGQFQMVRCERCGLYYLNPQPTMAELASFYPEDYVPYTTPSPDQLPRLRRLGVNYGLRKRRQAITRYKGGGRLLEIGCANGLFLDAMRRTGDWQVQGVDVGEPAVRYAREELGLDVFHGPLEDANFPDHAFDAVAMWDVLEHVPRPRETLLEIRRVLRPDGVLVLRVPQLDSWDRAMFGPYWAGWDAPRHLSLFSQETMARILERTGFCIIRMMCISGSYPTFAISTRFWAQEHLSDQAQERLWTILDSAPMRLLTIPFFWVVDRLGKGTVVTVVARPAGSGAGNGEVSPDEH